MLRLVFDVVACDPALRGLQRLRRVCCRKLVCHAWCERGLLCVGQSSATAAMAGREEPKHENGRAARPLDVRCRRLQRQSLQARLEVIVRER